MKFIHEFYRDDYGRKSKPERYILLNQQGETVSTPIVLKTANSIKALSDMLDRAAPLQFPKAVSVYDTKLNKTIEVIFQEKSTWRRTGFESVLPTQYKDMFSNKPKTTSESNLNLPASLAAVTPKIPALLISVIKLPSVAPVTVTSKSFSRIVSPGVKVGSIAAPVLVPYSLPLLWNFHTAPALYSVPLS